MKNTATEASSNRDITLSIHRDLMQEDDSAALRHLAEGRAIYYSKPDTPAGVMIKEYPDGKHEFVRFDKDGEYFVGDV